MIKEFKTRTGAIYCDTDKTIIISTWEYIGCESSSVTYVGC